jgi:hypothetical protein
MLQILSKNYQFYLYLSVIIRFLTLKEIMIRMTTGSG